MIKQLIEDLAYDKITLRQGLTRSKLIASKTRNESFKEWVNLELQGYPNDNQLPSFRKIPCQPTIVIGLPFGYRDTIPIAVDDPDVQQYYNEHRVTESITQIESTLENLTDQINLTIQLPTHLAVLLAESFQNQIEDRGGALLGIRKTFPKAAYKYVVDLTKQKLIDTLLELHEQFPNLENEFMATKENLNRVENIVNNHIYGNNNPVNVATGQNVTQKDITNNIGFSDYSKLEGLGVEKDEIEELREIFKNNQGDKSVLKEKVMKWAMPVMTAITARGLYDNTPQIMDFVRKLIE